MLVYSGSNGEMLCGSVRGTSETFIAVGTTSLVDRPASTAFYTTVHSYSELDHDLSTQVPLLGARRGSSAHHKTHHAKRIVANSMRACRQRIITSRSRTHAPTHASPPYTLPLPPASSWRKVAYLVKPRCMEVSDSSVAEIAWGDLAPAAGAAPLHRLQQLTSEARTELCIASLQLAFT